MVAMLETEALEATQERRIFTVSELNATARKVLEIEFPQIWLEGEISNIARPASGHMYFSLKDEQAQIRCAMFRHKNSYLNFQPNDGMHVLARGKISLYEGRGDYQLIVEHLEEAGDGALKRAFEALKKKLSQEGLFAEAHKKALPKTPQCIGVITSSTGAAIRDILMTLRRRMPIIPIIIYPTEVQGAQAAASIANMISTANRRHECDVIILARGGGSLEDLWAFNDEALARIIHQSQIPIITGIGHEIDFTIADFVADQRAATPTAAAELVSPDKLELQTDIQRLMRRIMMQMQTTLQLHRQHLIHLSKRLQHPSRRLQENMQQLDTAGMRLERAAYYYIQQKNHLMDTLLNRLAPCNPNYKITSSQKEITTLRLRLQQAVLHLLEKYKEQCQYLQKTLAALSPLATLQRGYAIVRDEQGKIIRQSHQLSVGDSISTQLHQGQITATIDKIV